MKGKTVNGYTLQSLLGAGGMAEVWLAENRIGKKAAVKLLLPKLCDDENVVSRFLTEAKVMVELNHRNIRQVYDFGDIDGRPCIIMEYLEGEDLKSKLKRGQRFSESDIESWWNQLVDALNYTHSKGIVHRDIKPGNIFIDENCVVKIGDFGSARISPQQKKEKEKENENEVEEKKEKKDKKEKKEKRPLTPGVGTKWYKAPEIIFGNKHYDKSVDIWSFGCLMAEMFLLEPLFPGSTDFEMINLIFSFIGFSKEDEAVLKPQLHINLRERPKNIFENTFDIADKDSIDLMSKMLVANPNKRITVEEILKHPFLKNEECYMNCNLPI